MKILLDTHIFIWFVENDDQLSLSLKQYIDNIQNEIYVSIATLWEIAIKVSLGKLEMSIDILTLIAKIEENGFVILPILPSHSLCVSKLPFHHRDPFDRMLIAQAITEQIYVISKDGSFPFYEIDLINS
jgi:PIN domain nuclease of toxin-antitoxin system